MAKRKTPTDPGTAPKKTAAVNGQASEKDRIDALISAVNIRCEDLELKAAIVILTDAGKVQINGHQRVMHELNETYKAARAWRKTFEARDHARQDAGPSIILPGGGLVLP